jgi:hypothetical protein
MCEKVLGWLDDYLASLIAVQVITGFILFFMSYPSTSLAVYKSAMMT